MAMQTQASLKQLEFSMWQDLKTAKSEPLVANLQQLWSKLEQVIELTDKNQKLRVLGDAIASMVEIYVMRANAILSTLETQDSSSGEPILSSDFLNDLMRQSMSIDLSDMMEKLFPSSEPKPRSPVPAPNSVVAPQDLDAACESASIVPDDPKQMLVELAGNEQVSQWSAAISNWMQQRSGGETVSLHQLQQALGIPRVEIWLGLLLSSQHQYDWETRGDFYSDAHSILLRQRQR
jgi:hypothetical protein